MQRWLLSNYYYYEDETNCEHGDLGVGCPCTDCAGVRGVAQAGLRLAVDGDGRGVVLYTLRRAVLCRGRYAERKGKWIRALTT